MRAALLSLLVGCSGPTPWGTGVSVDPGTDPFLAGRVSLAVDAWNRASFSYCGTPVLYIGGPGDHPIVYGDTDGHVGMFDGDRIVVERGPLIDDDRWQDTLEVVVHELGHAMGLGHVSIEDDPYSVMVPNLVGNTVPDWRDVTGLVCP